jgi:hypothetical protein
MITSTSVISSASLVYEGILAATVVLVSGNGEHELPLIRFRGSANDLIYRQADYGRTGAHASPPRLNFAGKAGELEGCFCSFRPGAQVRASPRKGPRGSSSGSLVHEEV